MKIVESLEDSGLSLNVVSDLIQKEINKQREGFLSMLLGTLAFSLLGNLLTRKG